MAKIQPFKALRPNPQFAAQVASRPYDVMNRSEAKEEALGNPNSFLHITRSEIDVPESHSPYDESVYLTARENLKAFLSRKIIFKESKPCYYIYRLTMNGHSQSGIVCVSSVNDYESDIIKKHEFTRPEKEKDRITHIQYTGAQTGNVFLAYRNIAAIDELVQNWQNNRSSNYNFTTSDGVQHEIWVVNMQEQVDAITHLFDTQVPVTYIADGHHRAASAFKTRNTFATEEANTYSQWFLTTLFPANQLQIMDYNRVVKDLNGHSSEQFLAALSKKFAVEKIGLKAFKPEQLHQFGMYLQGQWYKLSALPGTYTTDAIGVLDITILTNHILEPLLGILDQRTDARIDFIGGIRGMEGLQQRVDSGEAEIAFSLFPVSMDQLFDIADSGQVMPPKSTWFEPKLRDGLLTYQVSK